MRVARLIQSRNTRPPQPLGIRADFPPLDRYARRLTQAVLGWFKPLACEACGETMGSNGECDDCVDYKLDRLAI